MNAPQVSVVIRGRDEWPQIVGTILSFHEDLLASGISHEIVVVSNCSTDGTPEALLDKFRRWTRSGLLNVVRYDAKPSTWCAINAGVAASSGSVIFIADAHVSVAYGTCALLYSDALVHKGLWHAPVQLWGDEEQRTYGYDLKLEERFWGDPCRFVPPGCNVGDPWRIPMAGACLFAVEREEALRFGLYHPSFRAYGGGETYLAMKWWRLGGAVWIEPRALVRHAFGLRARWQPIRATRRSQREVYVRGKGITRELRAGDEHLAYSPPYNVPNEDFHYNFLLAAFTIGGREWLDRVSASFAPKFRVQKELVDIRRQVIRDGEPDRVDIDARAAVSLDGLLTEPPWRTCGRHAPVRPATVEATPL